MCSSFPNTGSHALLYSVLIAGAPARHCCRNNRSRQRRYSLRMRLTSKVSPSLFRRVARSMEHCDHLHQLVRYGIDHQQRQAWYGRSIRSQSHDQSAPQRENAKRLHRHVDTSCNVGRTRCDWSATNERTCATSPSASAVYAILIEPDCSVETELARQLRHMHARSTSRRLISRRCAGLNCDWLRSATRARFPRNHLLRFFG